MEFKGTSVVGVVKVFSCFLFAGLVVSVPTVSVAHSGGTDEHGCHAGTEPYHCHNGSDSSGSSSGSISGDDIAIAVGATALALGVIWYFSQCDDEEELHNLSHQEAPAGSWTPTIEVSGSESTQTTSVGLRYRF